MSAKDVNSEDLQALRSDNVRLKAENARLRAAQDTVDTATHRQRRVRPALAVILASIAVILLAAGNVLFWFGNTIAKPDRFVLATQPLVEDPEVRSASALFLTNKLFENVDVEKVTTDALPPRADFLAPALTNQVKTLTDNTLEKVFANPSVQQTWNRVLANQHERLVGFASGYEGTGTISLNQVFERARSNLSDTRLSFLADKQLPASVGDITVVTAEWLPAFHAIVTNIDTWRFLTILTLVLALSVAIWLSTNRRKMLYLFSIGASVMMLVTLIAIRLFVSSAAARAEPQYSNGVHRAAEIMLQPLRIQTITLLAALLVVAAITWISGTSPRAVALKNRIGQLFGGTMHDRIFSEEHTYTRWVAMHKRPLQWLVVIATAVVLLIVNLTLMSLVGYLSLMIILLLIIELLGGRNSRNNIHIPNSEDNNVNLKQGD